jgi:polyhydroxybutyrate depolymerase
MKIDRLGLLLAGHLVVLVAACSSSSGNGTAPKGGASSSTRGSGHSSSSLLGGTTNAGAAGAGGSLGASSPSPQGGEAGATAASATASSGGSLAQAGATGGSVSASTSEVRTSPGGQSGGSTSPSGGTASGGSNKSSTSTGGSGGLAGSTGAGGSSRSADAGAPVDSGTGTPKTCSSSASALAKGDNTRTIKVGDLSRTYLLHVPSSYTGTNPVPFVIDFHGMGDTPDKQKGMSGFLALSDAEGFLIAWPTGIDKAWNFGPCCTCSKTVDDLGFAKAMGNEVASLACIDLKRVYANGFSIGGAMTHYLACNAADVFAAATPSASDLLGSGQLPCQPVRPISVLAFRGTEDTTVPYAGLKGSTPNSCPAVLDMLGAEASLSKWASIDSCTGTPTTTAVTNGSQKLYTQCAGGVEVGLYTMQGAGHTPGPGKAAWSFLKTKSLP